MDVYLGLIFPFAGTFAPMYTAQCWGQQIPVNQNQALASILGNLYGGNGSTTFNLPDLRGRALVGSGTSPYLNTTLNPGTTGGTAAVTLTQANLPLHTHAASMTGSSGSSTINATVSIPVSTVPGGQTAPSTGNNNWLAGVNFNENGSGAAFDGLYTTTNPAGSGASLVGTATGNVTVAGGGTVTVAPGGGQAAPLPISNVQPFLAVTFFIVTQGTYPMRD